MVQNCNLFCSPHCPLTSTTSTWINWSATTELSIKQFVIGRQCPHPRDEGIWTIPLSFSTGLECGCQRTNSRFTLSCTWWISMDATIPILSISHGNCFSTEGRGCSLCPHTQTWRSIVPSNQHYARHLPGTATAFGILPSKHICATWFCNRSRMAKEISRAMTFQSAHRGQEVRTAGEPSINCRCDYVVLEWTHVTNTSTCLNTCSGYTTWEVCAGLTHPWEQLGYSIHNRVPTGLNQGAWQRTWQAVIIHEESDCRPDKDRVDRCQCTTLMCSGKVVGVTVLY